MIRVYILGVGLLWSTVVLAEATTTNELTEQDVSLEQVQQEQCQMCMKYCRSSMFELSSRW